MTNEMEVKILAVVQEKRYILVEELLASLPELTWNQLFVMVDELSRRGLICLRRRGFEYELRAFNPSTRRPVHGRDYALSGSV